VSMEELSQVLWRERELLEMLAFKLEVEQLVLAGGRSRWLAYAAREVETVLEAVQRTEVLRATTAEAVGAAAGLDTNPSLRALVDASDEPWRTILLDHSEAFAALTAQITQLAPVTRELLAAGYQAVRGAGLALSAAHDAYAPTGSAAILVDPAGAPADLQLQEIAYRAALAATDRVLQPTLLDFLR
jgi:hypothetical protein